ncbi:MAG: cell division protein ZapA [Ginsengibacter sp.]|jgi:cell division protein ZapA
MTTQSTIPLNIVIGDRNYRIKILPSDEESIRKALKLINDKIVEFRTQFTGKDMQDYIAMVLIWFATQEKSGKSDEQLSSSAMETLLKMELQIDSTLG